MRKPPPYQSDRHTAPAIRSTRRYFYATAQRLITYRLIAGPFRTWAEACRESERARVLDGNFPDIVYGTARLSNGTVLGQYNDQLGLPLTIYIPRRKQ